VSADAIRQGLRENGYVEGRNLVIEYRAADAKLERLPRLAAELVRLKVDIIVAASTPVARAAQDATRTIPIVAVALGDPVGDGLAVSLAQPGGNLTGSTFLGPGLVPKRLEYLKEAIPRISRVAALWHPGAFGDATTKQMFEQTETVARKLEIRLKFVEARRPDDLDQALSAIARERVDALVTFPSTMLYNLRRRIVDLVARHRLPAMFNAKEFVELGGLIAYGASLVDLNRRAGRYVDKILKGAKPAYLPIEQPTQFELAINLKTAKALGLTIPPSLLARADEVIE
jgi:putative ABC transport system substrate-binding protein